MGNIPFHIIHIKQRELGFVNVRKVEFGIEGTDKRLIKEKEVRKHETLVMEAQKP
jgi:hypothetical protein